MITSKSVELNRINLPSMDAKLSMVRFDLRTLIGVPSEWTETVKEMLSGLKKREGTAYLTVDGKVVKPNTTHRRGGAHIDGNYLEEFCGWGSGGGGNGWKVGEGGAVITSDQHKRSYQKSTGGMLIASSYPACIGWNGNFEGKAKVGGDCTHLELGDGFVLKAKTVYYGNSQFIHESAPLDKEVHRTVVRITLPENHPVQ